MAKDKRIVAGVISDTKYYYASDGSVVDEDGKPAPAKFAAMFPPMPKQKSEEPAKETKPKKTRRRLKDIAGRIKNSKYYYDKEGNVVDEEGKPVNEKLANTFGKREAVAKSLPKVESKKQTSLVESKNLRVINAEISKALKSTQNIAQSNEIIQSKMPVMFDAFNDVVKTLGEQNDIIVQRLIQQNQEFQDKVIESMTGVPSATKSGGAKPRKINPKAVGGSKAARGTELKVKATNYRETRKKEVEDRASKIAGIRAKRNIAGVAGAVGIGAAAGVGSGALISSMVGGATTTPPLSGGAGNPSAAPGGLSTGTGGAGSIQAPGGVETPRPNSSPAQNRKFFVDALNKYQVTNPEERAAMAAVVQGESGFALQSEVSYARTNNGRIRDIFSKFRNVSDDQLNQIKSNPVTFFNAVYGGRYGNAPNEGYKYRGRGFIQLTFKGNYEKFGKITGFDLVNNPDLANDPAIAAEIAVKYMKTVRKGGDTYTSIARGVGNPVASTESKKVAAYNQFLRSGEFNPDRGGATTTQTAAIPGSPQASAPGATSAPSTPGSPQIASAAPQPPIGTGGIGSIQAPGGTDSSELIVKGGMRGQAFAGGAVHPATLKMAKMIQSSVQGFDRFTGFNDKYHEGTNSRHAKGLAGDFTVSNPAFSAAAAETVRQIAKQLGASVYVIDEYKNPSSRATAGHIHYQFTDQRSADLVMGQGQTQVASAGAPRAYAAGDPYVPNTGPAIVGERGPELVVGKDGSSRVTGSGSHVENLNIGDSVVPADKTKQLMGYAGGTRAASTMAGSLSKNFTAPEDTRDWANSSKEEKAAMMTLNKRAGGDNKNISQILQQKNSPQYATELERATKRFEGDKSFGNFGTIDRKLIEESEGKINSYAEAYKPNVVREETTYDLMGNVTQPAFQYNVEKTAEEKQQALQQHREQQSNAYDALSRAMSEAEPDNGILSNLSYALGISSKEKEANEAKKSFGMPGKIQKSNPFKQKYADGTRPPKKTGKPIKQAEPEDKTAEIGLSLLKTGVSFIPGVGQVVAGLDAANELRKGNIGGALKAGLGAIPGGGAAMGIGKMVAGEAIDQIGNRLTSGSEQNAMQEYTKPPAVKTVIVNNNRTNNVKKTVYQGSSLPKSYKNEPANPLAQGGNKRTAMGAF